jgi:hypothetical protein
MQPTSSSHPAEDLEERERKFLPDAAAADAFWRVASEHLVPEHGPGVVTHSRTTYFDTDDLVFYRSSNGPVMRRVRVREYMLAYGPTLQPHLVDHCYLELKRSSGTRRSKRRLRIRPDQVSGELALLVGPAVKPCVATGYRRRALVDVERSVRVTLDDMIVVCRPQEIGSAFSPLSPRGLLAHGPSLVLECKTRGTPPPWLVHALRRLREVTRFSKFVLGMNTVLAEKAEQREPSFEHVAAAG